MPSAKRVPKTKCPTDEVFTVRDKGPCSTEFVTTSGQLRRGVPAMGEWWDVPRQDRRTNSVEHGPLSRTVNTSSVGHFVFGTRFADGIKIDTNGTGRRWRSRRTRSHGRKCPCRSFNTKARSVFVGHARPRRRLRMSGPTFLRGQENAYILLWVWRRFGWGGGRQRIGGKPPWLS